MTDHIARKLEHLPSSETRALLLSENTFRTKVGHRAGLSTNMELEIRPSERLQPGGYGPSQ